MSDWVFHKLDEFVKSGAIELGRGEIISRIDIDAHPGSYPIYSSSAQADGKFGEYGKYIFDEELISWSVDGGGNFFFRPKHKFSVTNVSGFLRIKSRELSYRFLYYCLAQQHQHIHFDYTTKAHPSVIRRLYSIPKLPLPYQEKLGEILASNDEAITASEALILKYQQLKAGLMHDLFTRGVTKDGKLRSPREEAPEMYKKSLIGLVPKEWDVDTLGKVAESLIDGPFGSNLKTEHYVSSPGVRVVRLQNIQAGAYDDTDKAFISERHASNLIKNKVVSGDILIAALGDDNYPVGRACLYPRNLESAINKADCFRLRCRQEKANHGYVMNFLNTSCARQQTVRYVQGVTRHRINSGNMRKVIAVLPPLPEQVAISERIMAVDGELLVLEAQREKLIQQKHGLMRDLLTGHVRVNCSN